MPLPLREPVFTYSVEAEVGDSLVGKLVIVPFGIRKTYTGVVIRQNTSNPHPDIKIKTISKILPYAPIAPIILKLWHWISDYYMCSLGDVFVASVQYGFRPDGYQETQPIRATATILRGFLPAKRLMEDALFQQYILDIALKNDRHKEAVRYILENYQIGSKPPMTLKKLSEWIGVSPSVITKLRSVGAIESAEVIASDLPDDLIFPRRKVGDQLSEKVHIGGRNILLLHCPNSRLEQRIPYDFILDTLKDERQVLLLVPTKEALSILSDTLYRVFGERIRYYHSGLSSREQQMTWVQALSGKGGLYVGVRSAVLLPLGRLEAVVVIDEEDTNYRQFEPSPRYTATNVALMLAHYAHKSTILVSSTPAIESYTLALQKKYSFAESPSEVPHLAVKGVWMPKAYEQNSVQARMLSFEMLEAMSATLDSGGHTLLYYHRKGFARRATCQSCHSTPTCPTCHTPLRYIEETGNLVCGICGYHIPLPHACPICGSPSMKLEGTGIERLRRAIQEGFPQMSVCLEEELDRRTHLPDIILSASAVPLLDLHQKVSMIGIVQLDLLSATTDYRSNELAYRFIVKCRDESPLLKHLFIQHFAEHPNALSAFLSSDYSQLLDYELEQRHLVQFPPFSRHIDIYFESLAQAEAYALAEHSVGILNEGMTDATALGPAPIPVRKANATVGYKVSLFVPLYHPSHKVREVLWAMSDRLLSGYRGPKMSIYYDVDPI